VFIFKYRRIVLILCLLVFILAVYHLPALELQPYPLQQLPESTTILKSENLLNQKFSGTVPFKIEIKSTKAGTFLGRENLRLLEESHRILTLNPDVGFQHSVLTIIKRIHYYFNNSDPRYEIIPERENEETFQALIEQYLLFYSATASPEEYESLIDSNRRSVAIEGILKYRDAGSIADFLTTLERMEEGLPEEWDISLYGPAEDLVQRRNRLKYNWFVSFGSGSLLIFLTVLVFFKNVKMSFISLIPSFFILVIITGISSMLGVKMDEYTIILVPIITGLTIDYTIHILNAIGHMKKSRRGDSPSIIDINVVQEYGSTLIRNSGIPVFLSFLTSVVAFASLYLSSFSGAVHFGVMLLWRNAVSGNWMRVFSKCVYLARFLYSGKNKGDR
jgi:predicted RND superfamily exporter protein